MVDLLLKGTPVYYQLLVPEVAERMEKKGLVFVIVSLPGGCSYRCMKCFTKSYGAQLKEDGYSPPFVFSDADSKKLLEEAHKLGARCVVVPGFGEPMEAPGIEHLIKTCSGLGMNLIVFTNGKHFDKKTAKRYFDSGVSVVFTLDAFSEKNYDKLTGAKGNYPIVRKNLDDALALAEKRKEKKGKYPAVPLAVNTSVSQLVYDPSKKIDEIKQISKLINGRVPHFVSHPSCTGNAAVNWQELIGMPRDTVNPALVEGAAKYSREIGISGRKLDQFCGYLHNGVAQYAGFWMMCPNVGPQGNLGRYPTTTVEQHFSAKQAKLSSAGQIRCWSRRE